MRRRGLAILLAFSVAVWCGAGTAGDPSRSEGSAYAESLLSFLEETRRHRTDGRWWDAAYEHLEAPAVRERRLVWQEEGAVSVHNCSRPLTSESVVLVTGAAGFIGHALVKELSQRVRRVVGVDNFNDYYSPSYKEARVTDLLKNGTNVQVHAMDVCNTDEMEQVMEGVTHVVHLAAQAGVRYSKMRPESYIRQNIKCFLHLLELLRGHAVNRTTGEQTIGFVYASSSSVYGDNRHVPFSEDDAVDRPNNLYGATKRANELMAQSYATLFGLNSVGLRFFTVYGPWGRPDMAAFKFMRLVSNGEPISLFRKGDMIRDFTYVDDIVDGIIGAMMLCDSGMQLFNLGNSDPVPLLDFVGAIERYAGKEAIVRDGGPGRGEIHQTYANITKARALLGYQPGIGYEEGLQRFARWYSSMQPEVSAWYSGAFLNRLSQAGQSPVPP